jgi:response regulator RpfG family c-di-GMP phosphodiesterase/HD-like signal output (HDOD) protein
MLHKIMVVDDEPANLRLLERLFRRDYQVITASSGDEALELLNQHDVSVLVSDQRMPGMTGIELLKRSAEFRPHMVRIILTGYTDVGALVEAINCGHVYKYVTKPWSNDDLRLTVERALQHHETNKSRSELEQVNLRLNVRLQESKQGIVRIISDALEAKDEHLCGHARRVSGLSTAIGRRMRLDIQSIEQISLAAFMHDLGKLGTPDSILLKPGTLTSGEREVMQQHAVRGARMFAGVPDMHEVADAVRYHHENFDGTGYPEGLRGEQIPLSARIISVADVYDTLRNPRPFREAYTHDSAVRQLERLAGTQFDPQVVDAFRSIDTVARIHRSITSGFYGTRLNGALNESELGHTSFEDLIRLVETEPVLAALVLAEANTMYGAEPVASLHVACARIGEINVRALVVHTYGLDRCAHNPDQLAAYAHRCAIASRLLAEQTALLDPDEAYMLGLTHDLGKLLLLAHFPEEMEHILWVDEEGRSDREIAAFGMDHAGVGQWILQACHVPRALTDAVQAHHAVMRTNAPSALLLHLADAIAHADHSHMIAALNALGTDRLAMLKLTRADLAAIHTRTAQALEYQLVTY